MIESEQQFLDCIVHNFIKLSYNNVENNWDHELFAWQNKDGSTDVRIEEIQKFITYFIQNYKDFYFVFSNFANDYSKNLYISLILFRMLGHLRHKLSTNNEQHWKIRKDLEQYCKGESSLPMHASSGKLKHYTIPFNGYDIEVDGIELGVTWAFLYKQYYLNSDDVVIMPETGDYILDIGACYGDTALAFAASVGEKGKVYSFDFLPNHIYTMKYNTDQNPSLKDRVETLHVAISDKNNDVDDMILSDTFKPTEGDKVFSGAVFDESSMDDIPIRTIDRLVEDGTIERVDFIKMDIEGAEQKAVQGAKNTIEKYKPKLALSIYHSPDDFVKIPRLIVEMDLGYKLYIDHYTIHNNETILYAKK